MYFKCEFDAKEGGLRVLLLSRHVTVSLNMRSCCVNPLLKYLRIKLALTSVPDTATNRCINHPSSCLKAFEGD